MNIPSVISRLKRFEGWTLFPYKDSKGIITIGCGNAIFSLSEYLTLPWHDPQGNLPSSSLIESDYQSILKSPKGYVYNWYSHLTQCRLLDSDVEASLEKDISQRIPELKKELPLFLQVNDNVQEALFDISYNVGVQGLLKFHRMLSAIEQENWPVASKESFRPEVGEARNVEISQLLLLGGQTQILTT